MRYLILLAAIGITLNMNAQKSPVKIKPGIPSFSAPTQKYDDKDLSKTPSIATVVNPSGRGTAEITTVNIGNSANAYGLYSGGRTVLWAEPSINAITFAHRMTIVPGSGYIAYDLSKDGGNTWTVNKQVFNPTAGGTAPARYPQGLIYNPQGNTNADNAYFSAFFPTLDGSNAGANSWGGYGVATEKLIGTGLTQDGWSSDPPIRQNVPDAMTINPVTGDIFVVEPGLINGLGTGYTDTLVVTHGVFNNTTNAFDYDQYTLYAPMVHIADVSSIADTKIAFAPDGMTGYILLLGDNEQDAFATGLAYYPILLKTTDGGANWDENQITVPLGGTDGLSGIVNDLLTDDQIAQVFSPPLPNRDEIVYTTAFTSDLSVDMNGNPVISTVIGVASSTPYSIVSGAGLFASYNIYSTDKGTTWYGVKLGSNLKTFRGTWGDVTEDNRSQITSTKDGTKMFFSWLDTDFEGFTDNQSPDIYCAAWNVTDNTYTEVTNVTYLSDAWLQAFMGTASNYAFTPQAGSYVIPFVYQEMSTTDPTQPVQYKYIKDFTITDAMFTIQSAKDLNVIKGSVSQNYPNPFKDKTEIVVNLDEKANVSLEVYNITGQKVYEVPKVTLQKGSHSFSISGKDLNAGIYTYSVKINDSQVTRKMVVK
jgi:hypothetical protein